MSDENKTNIDTEEEKKQKLKWMELSNIIKFLEKKGMEIKECAYVQSRTEFIKGKILNDFIKENIEEVCKQINKAMNTKINPENPDKAILEIYEQLRSSNIIKKACREEGDKKKNIKRLLPYEEMVLINKCNCGKDHDKEELDHPQKLDLKELFKFDPSYYYVLNIYRSKSMIYIYLALIIFFILMYALMPVWPYCVKVGVWWVSFVLLCVILGIYAVRLIIYVFCFTFGYDVWVFPDIDDNKLGFFESFYRVISVEKRNEEWYTIVIRVFLAILTSYIGFKIYKNPSIVDEAKKLVVDAIRDIYAFGEDKIVNAYNTTAIQLKNKQKVKSLQEIDDLI